MRPAAEEPLDEVDRAILDAIRERFQRADPMPADLPERIRFSLALRDLEAEVARLAAEQDPRALAVRGAEQSRTITFDSDSLTIMIRISQSTDTVRIDGWLAPPQACRVELRSGERTLNAAVDVEGRFVLEAIPRGLAQLVVRLDEALTAGGGPAILTPAIVL
jgi:hypothetical protein